MCFNQYFKKSMQKFCLINSVLVEKKTAGTVFDQKFFSHIFMKFYSNKCVSFNILICACKNSIWITLLSIEKTPGQELCLIKSVSVTFS